MDPDIGFVWGMFGGFYFIVHSGIYLLQLWHYIILMLFCFGKRCIHLLSHAKDNEERATTELSVSIRLRICLVVVGF